MDRRASLFAISSSLFLLLAGRWPAMAQDTKPKRIAYLGSGRAGPAFEAFKEGLAVLGYESGRHFVIDARFPEARADRLPALAEELVRSDPDVVVTSGAIAIRAAKVATSRIPIIFAAVLDRADIVTLGFAASAERPGANLTGFSSFDPEQAAKSFRLFKEILPKLDSIALLGDQDIPPALNDPRMSAFERHYDNAARSAGLRPLTLRLKGPMPDLEGAFTTMAREKIQAMLVMEVPVPLQHVARIVELAKANLLPIMLPGGYPNAGALLNFGTSIVDANRATAEYVDKVLRGANPGELPIGSKSRNELVINLKTAVEIGVTIPLDLVKRADRVIQ